MKGRLLRLLAVAAAVLALLVSAALWQLRKEWSQLLDISGEGYTLTIAQGDSLRTVASRLQRDGVMAHTWMLRAYGRWSGLDQQVKPGEYLVPRGATAESLLLLLQSGRVIQYQLTLPEGITLAAALTLLSRAEAVRGELEGPADPRIAALVQPMTSAEGLFFPDTYQYERGASDWELLQRAYDAMQTVLAEEWSARSPGLPYANPYEALIMASLVERETGLAQERAQIAGVFVRRLQQGMRLQTDPAVIYGLDHSFDGNLRRSHLADDDNPYNTYRHGGLPPTPIALPGRSAIHAALHPAEGDALYFVARGDGGHAFSATLAEHERAVRKYQLRRREDYRSSPEKP
jgi:UPF0755 protein